MSSFQKFFRELSNVRRHLVGAAWLKWCGGLLTSLPAVVREKSLGPVDGAFGPDFKFKVNGGIYKIRGGSFGLVREIFGQECYAKPDEISGAKRILDLGANCGVFSLFALINAPRATVFGVEALPELARLAQSNLVLNNFGDRARVANGIVGTERNDWTVGLEAAHGPVPRFSGPQLMKEFPGGQIDFMKCDIEGAEYDLFQGDLSWLQQVNRLAIEYHGRWADGEALAERLRKAGYEVIQEPHRDLGYLRCRLLS